MKKIEINTSHNIVIEFQLASVGNRIIATIIDWVILGVYIIVVTLGFGASDLLLYVLALPVVGFYHLLFEVFFDGQSPGKMIMRTKVISIEGTAPTLISLFTRWVFRMIDLTGSFGGFGIFYISSTKNNQRLGDILANTAVVNLKQNSNVSLQSFEDLKQIKHQVLFPEVSRYTDKDMLLIKDTLQRLNANKNEATIKIANQLAKKISQDLGLKKLKVENKKFLTQILNDYIILTR